jgi:hypothetical protein
VAGEPSWLWSALSPKGYEFASPDSMDPCPSCALFTRPTQIGACGRWPLPDPSIFDDWGS